MTSLLLNDFLSQYGMLIALVFILVALMLFNMLGKKKEDTYKTNLRQSIVVGAKVKTYAGIYGTVKALRDSKDGTVVTLACGEEENSATMDIHIDAIYAIDYKDEPDDITEGVEVLSEEKTDAPVVITETAEVNAPIEEVKEAEAKPVAKKTPAKSATSKSTATKSTAKKTTAKTGATKTTATKKSTTAKKTTKSTKA